MNKEKYLLWEDMGSVNIKKIKNIKDIKNIKNNFNDVLIINYEKLKLEINYMKQTETYYQFC